MNNFDSSPSTPMRAVTPRGWLARNWVACLAMAIVAGYLIQKNTQIVYGQAVGLWYRHFSGFYGWPRCCVWCHVNWWEGFGVDPHTGMVPVAPKFAVRVWPSLAYNGVVWLVALVFTGLVLSRTQRHCHRWWQISLGTVLAVISLLAIMLRVWQVGPLDFPPDSLPW
jgi:hypothetical protein